MSSRILVIDGHPDPAPERFLHALANAYRDGAAAARHEVRCVRVADLNFSLLRSQLQRGKSARVIVTMGMPAFVYRWFYRAHSVRSLRRNILKFVGFGSVRTTLIGGVGAMSKASRSKHLARLRALGAKASTTRDLQRGQGGVPDHESGE
ncbi:MAG: NAD(P)H-dependent oxidoreductase [Steroidobacter sp.]